VTNAANTKRTTLTKIFGFSRLLTWKKIENNSMIAMMTAVIDITQFGNLKTPDSANITAPMDVQTEIINNSGREKFPSFWIACCIVGWD